MLTFKTPSTKISSLLVHLYQSVESSMRKIAARYNTTCFLMIRTQITLLNLAFTYYIFFGSSVDRILEDIRDKKRDIISNKRGKAIILQKSRKQRIGDIAGR